jgi:hypothetical protein
MEKNAQVKEEHLTFEKNLDFIEKKKVQEFHLF